MERIDLSNSLVRTVVSVAGGTALNFALGGEHAGLLAGITAQSAAVLAGLFSNIWAGDLAARWNNGCNDPSRSHPNHDLAKLIGKAVAHVLHELGKEHPTHAAWFQKLAEQAEKSYADLASHPVLQDRVDTAQLPGWFASAAQGDGSEPLIGDTLMWSYAVQSLRQQAKLPDNEPAQNAAAAALTQRLFPAVREMLKRDFAGEGRAYAALSLDIQGQLLAGILRLDVDHQSLHNELAALRQAVEQSITAKYSSLNPKDRQQFSYLVAQVRVQGQRLDELLVLEKDTNLTVQRIDAGQDDIKIQLANIERMLREDREQKRPGEDPTMRRLTPELEAQARLLLERGDRQQQAEAEIALRNHIAADALIQELKREPLAEAFRLLTLEGDNWYQAGAIGPFEQALALRASDLQALINVGVARSQARLDSTADHRARAIDVLTHALQVAMDRSVEWAMTQNNLGVAWVNLPTETRNVNLQNSIDCFTAALEVYTRAENPIDWAKTQNNLGNAWSEMPTGDRTVNLSKAIDCYTAALEIRIRAEYPVAWAMTQNNLGIAWSEIPTGDRTVNLRKAIDYYMAILEVYTRAEYPVAWATTQNNLGVAWSEMPTGSRTVNLRKAIDCYTAALEVRTPALHPADWAMTQNNLGIACRNMPTGDRAVNLQKAIACYTAALEVYTRVEHPANWAMTQTNLAIAMADLAAHEPDRRCELLGHAIAAGKASLEVLTPDAFPDRHAATLKNLEMDRHAYETAGCHTQRLFEDIQAAP